MLKQFTLYVYLFLIYRHLYTSLPRSSIILIVMDGAILLRPHEMDLFGQWTGDLAVTDTDDDPSLLNCNIMRK